MKEGKEKHTRWSFVYNPSPRRFNLMNRQILHDPDFYANPLEFNPGRFLGDHPEPDPSETVFGYGRRICECFCFILIHLSSLYAVPCGIDSGEQRVVQIPIEKGIFSLLFLQTTETADPLCSTAVFFVQVRDSTLRNRRYGSLVPCRWRCLTSRNT